MRELTRTLGQWRDRFRNSITLKIGGIFVALAIVGGVILLLSLYLTRELIETSGSVNLAGMHRARVYKLSSLVQELHDPSVSEVDRAAIRYEMARWRRAMEAWQFESPHHRSFGELNPELHLRIEEVQDRWVNQLSPLLERAMSPSEEGGLSAAREFLRHTDPFVEVLSDITRGLSESRTEWIRTLYGLQILFFALLLIATLVAFVLLHRVILEPLKTLTMTADRLSGGSLATSIPISTGDELGQLARTFERLAANVRHKVGELETLHSIMQGISTWGQEGRNAGLRGLVDRAADLLKTDLAVLLVRHPVLELWVIEAASGVLFEATEKKILLVEETPMSNRALTTKQPVIVHDITQDRDLPIRAGEEFGATSFMAVPLLRSNACNGVLLFIDRGEPREFTSWDVRLAQQIASYAAVAVEDARMFAETASESQLLQKKISAVERQVAELTHEVKAPAGRVVEFATWLERDYQDNLDGRARRYLGWIKKEAADLGQLAQRTIDIARLTHVQTPIESVEVGGVVADVLRLLEREIEQKRVEVTVHPDLPLVACRRIHLKQVLENLIGNGIKYMGQQPEPRIEVGCEQSRHGARLFVRDNGVGIDPAMQDRIFEPFQRLGTVDAPGAGVGLAIVKAVVEHYGGTVSVTSSQGKGSTFFFRLPVIEEK